MELSREATRSSGPGNDLDGVGGLQGCKDEVEIEPILNNLIRSADLLCTAPDRSAQSPYRGYNPGLARGILIDEATNMIRADYACVAGNCLLPCFKGGDLKLRSAVMPKHVKDDLGHYYNRLVAMSPLTLFQASVMPVYRPSQRVVGPNE